MNIKLINMKTISQDKLGKLTFFETGKEVPFPIERIFYTYGAPAGARRGGHAHKECWEYLFCTYGEITVKLNDGSQTEEIRLKADGEGLLMAPATWIDLIWETDNAALCVANSHLFEESDYIRDYDAFLIYINGRKIGHDR